MNQYTKRKLNEALEFTQNDINKMPTDKLYDYVKIMTKEANRRRDILINNPKMENNPIRDEVIERGKYIMPKEDERFLRQKLISVYSKTYNLLTTKSSTLTGWGEIRKETRKRFIEKFKSRPDTDTKELSQEAKEKNQRLMFISHSKLNDFWDLYNKIAEDPEVIRWVQGLDTNTLLQDVYEIADSYNFEKLDEKVESSIKKLVGMEEGSGILRERYYSKNSGKS